MAGDTRSNMSASGSSQASAGAFDWAWLVAAAPARPKSNTAAAPPQRRNSRAMWELVLVIAILLCATLTGTPARLHQSFGGLPVSAVAPLSLCLARRVATLALAATGRRRDAERSAWTSRLATSQSLEPSLSGNPASPGDAMPRQHARSGPAPRPLGLPRPVRGRRPRQSWCAAPRGVRPRLGRLSRVAWRHAAARRARGRRRERGRG